MMRLLCAVVLFGTLLPHQQPARGPNIVFLLADDLGWSDTTVYGSTFYETPSLERLAKGGMTFTHAYSASPLCSPTRASILTGQYPGRLRLTTPSCHIERVVLDPTVPETAGPDNPVTIPGTRTRLPNEYVTYAEILKEAGYRTGFFGKWHLGRAPYLPEQQGFDVVVGGRHHPGPPGGYFAPWPIDTIPKSPEGSHIDDVITTEALKFLEAARGRPFLLNLWFYSVHAPFEAKQPLIKKYRAKAASDPDNRQTNPVMGGMIETLDRNVGRVLDALKRLGLLENTLILFTSDNGGNMYNFVEGVEATNNAPLRGGKGHICEGGHRVPLIASWKGKIKAGTRSDAVVTSVDYFPTLLEIIGLDRPKGQVCDGVSLAPLLRDNAAVPSRPVFCHFPHGPTATGNLPSTSVRKGDWKLIRFYGDGPEQQDRLELYNVVADIGEATNLAARETERAAGLNALISEHLDATQSLVPAKNPRYRPSILGWLGSKDAELSRPDGILKIDSKGDDPWIRTAAFPRVSGSATVEIRMRSSSRGGGAVFVATKKNPKFQREGMKPFEVHHDGAWHTYRIEFKLESQLTALRIDPSNAAGTIEIDRIRLIDWKSPGAGKVARDWRF